MKPIVLNAEQLRLPSVAVEADAKSRATSKSLLLAITKGRKALGIAAPQIGVRRAIIAVNLIKWSNEFDGDPKFAVLNPRYEAIGDDVTTDYEGCLSFPGRWYPVERHNRIRFSGTTPTGDEINTEFAGWPARVLQHETDHLAGLIIPDVAAGDPIRT